MAHLQGKKFKPIQVQGCPLFLFSFVFNNYSKSKAKEVLFFYSEHFKSHFCYVCIVNS